MVCEVCGRKIENENANFCEYCGASLRESYNLGAQIENVRPIEVEEKVISKEQNAAEDGMSFRQWMSVLILPFIPIVGFVFYLVTLFIWGFSNNASKTRKNWARATLLTFGVALVYLAIMLPEYLTLLQ